MSVRANERRRAGTEYYRHFGIVYQVIQDKMLLVSKRKKKWFSVKIMELLNSVGRTIAKIEKGYILGQKKKEIREKYATDALYQLEKLQPLLWVLWNEEQYKDKTMERWCELLNKELELLNEIACRDNLRIFTKIDWEKVNKLKFLKNISVLDKEAYSFSMRLSNKFTNLYAERLVGNLDSCFCNLLSANDIYPHCRDEYVKRRQYISDAICDLHYSSEAIRDLAIQKLLDDETIEKWSELIEEELRLLNGLNNSDKRNFSKL